MGSYGKAIMAGFICRLCSEQKKCVVHLYSEKAKNFSLLEKITLLPIKVHKFDKLPKTICEKCIVKLEMQYKLIQQIRKSADVQYGHRLMHSYGMCPTDRPYRRFDSSLGTSLSSTSNAELSASDENENEEVDPSAILEVIPSEANSNN